MKWLSVVGLRVGIQDSIRNVGPASTGARTLGHNATTDTLLMLHPPYSTALWRSKKRQVLATHQQPLLFVELESQYESCQGL